MKVNEIITNPFGCNRYDSPNISQSILSKVICNLCDQFSFVNDNLLTVRWIDMHQRNILNLIGTIWISITYYLEKYIWNIFNLFVHSVRSYFIFIKLVQSNESVLSRWLCLKFWPKVNNQAHPGWWERFLGQIGTSFWWWFGGPKKFCTLSWKGGSTFLSVPLSWWGLALRQVLLLSRHCLNWECFRRWAVLWGAGFGRLGRGPVTKQIEKHITNRRGEKIWMVNHF